ncbi:MAG: DUF4352 domain-containing protein [Ruminococcus sp.]|nr:DUF4352 domain-containing protein [Ruminococcus sp.]
MKKFKFAVLFLAAAIAIIPSTGCRLNSSSDSDSSSDSSGYAGMFDVAVTQMTTSLGDETTVDSTTYTLNRVIDSGMVKDDLKYIYLDVTIKNSYDEDYETNALNNFYLILEDGTEITTDIRADNYGKQSIDGYEHLSEIPAGGEFSGYIGFCVDEDVTDFTVGFFVTGSDINDKSTVIYCSVGDGDIISALDGFIIE